MYPQLQDWQFRCLSFTCPKGIHFTFYVLHFNNVPVAAARSIVYCTYTDTIRWEVASFNYG